MTDFPIFIDTLSNKLAIDRLLKMSPHLVATPPCELKYW